jgi:nucleolar protein 4
MYTKPLLLFLFENRFKAFGPVRYARIVMDPVTKRSRGTGFVNFYKEEDAIKCLDESERLEQLTNANRDSSKGKEKTHQPQSLLTIDPSSSTAASLTLHGRVLGVSEAVSKGSADKLREERDRKGKTKDRRNLYLMHEGGKQARARCHAWVFARPDHCFCFQSV